MKIIKKTIVFILCFVTVFGAFVACGNETDNASNGKNGIVNELGGEKIAFDDTDAYLVRGGASDYKIVIGADATKTEKYAAEELQYFIEKSTAVTLGIITDEEVATGAKFISVGATSQLAARTDVSVAYSELGENGVAVYTKNNNVYVSGATENGTLFAVYRFLHFQVGYAAYAYDCVEVDYYSELKLKNFDYKYVPSLGLTTAEDAELSGESKVKEASRMYVYASKNGGYDLNGNLFNGLWCHTIRDIVGERECNDAYNVKAAQKAERTAKLSDEAVSLEYNTNADFRKGFEKGLSTLFSSAKGTKDEIDKNVAIKEYGYVTDKKKQVLPNYKKVMETKPDPKDPTKTIEEPKIEKGNYVYVTGEDGNPVLETGEDGNPLTNIAGYENYVKGWDEAYEKGNFHVGAEWQKKVKSVRIWNNDQACYTKERTLEIAYDTIVNKYLGSATGPYIMVGITDGKGSCDCEDCIAEERKYEQGGAAAVQMHFMNALANKLEKYMSEKQGMENKQITLVAFAYYAYREPPVKLVNGEYVAIDETVKPKSAGNVRVGVMFTPIEACYTHPITDDGETCEKNAAIAEEMKGWAAITDYLMMYSYGTNFMAYKYHFNNWSHIGDSIRFYEKVGLKYYFEQACAQNGISPMSSMRAYVRSRLAWNSAYNTQDLIDEFIEHYYGDGADGVKQYFAAVMENFERVYTLAETEEEGIYYNDISSASNWTRPLLLQLQSYLEKADYDVDLGSSAEKDVYKERIFREYFLLKDNEFTMYSAYLNSDELAALEGLVMYGREKYNAYKSQETTNG